MRPRSIANPGRSIIAMHAMRERIVIAMSATVALAAVVLGGSVAAQHLPRGETRPLTLRTLCWDADQSGVILDRMKVAELWIGKHKRGGTFRIIQAKPGGKWSLVVTEGDGTACVVGVGTDGQVVPDAIGAWDGRSP